MYTFMKTMSLWGKVSETVFCFRMGLVANCSLLYRMFFLNKVSFVVCLYKKQVETSQMGQKLIAYPKLLWCILFVMLYQEDWILFVIFAIFRRKNTSTPIFFGRCVPAGGGSCVQGVWLNVLREGEGWFAGSRGEHVSKSRGNVGMCDLVAFISLW